MAYTPNNPLVPGDPYMYDSRWIISKLKEAIKLYAPLAKDFEDLKNYVDTYFENLDVEQQIKDAIQKMIDDGTLSQMILDAFNELDVRVNKLEGRTPADYFYNYSKVGEIEHPNGSPAICCYNPVANCVTYVSHTSGGTSKIGYLASDNITPVTSQTIALNHASDIDYCNAQNVLLLADMTADDSAKVYRLNPATNIVIDEMDLSEWTGSFITAVACDNKNNLIYLYGASADHSKPHTAKIDAITGRLIEQFDLYSLVNGWEQGAIVIDEVFYIAYTPLGDLNNDGLIFFAIDFDKQLFTRAAYFNIKGETESVTLINNDLWVYGFVPAASGSKSYVECSVLTQGTRAIENSTIYVNETASLNGDGKSSTPFNNLNSALYTALNAPIPAIYKIELQSNISKYVNPLPAYFPIKLNFSMGTYTWTVSNIVAFPSMSILKFSAGTLTFVSGGRFDFDQSDVMFDSTTINRKDAAFNIVALGSKITTNLIVVNLNVSDASYAPFYIRNESMILLNVASLTTVSTSNHVVFTNGGVIINTMAITGLTTPFVVQAGGIALGV